MCAPRDWLLAAQPSLPCSAPLGDGTTRISRGAKGARDTHPVDVSSDAAAVAAALFRLPASARCEQKQSSCDFAPVRRPNMTEPYDENREQRSRKRARQSFDLALGRIRAAIEFQLQVLADCTDQIRDAPDDKSLQSAHFKTSNEIKKLEAIVCQLDALTSRLPADELAAVSPEIQQIRQQVLGQNIHLLSDHIRSARKADESHLGGDEAGESGLPVRDGESNMALEADVTEQKLLLQSWKRLEADLLDLNEAANKFSQYVWSQKETTDRTDTNISEAHDNFQSGAIILSKIKKGSALPLVGAAVGTAIGGPIGMVLGFKAAAVACLGAATVGYFGGRAVQQLSAPPAITRMENSAKIEERARDR